MPQLSHTYTHSWLSTWLSTCPLIIISCLVYPIALIILIVPEICLWHRQRLGRLLPGPRRCRCYLCSVAHWCIALSSLFAMAVQVFPGSLDESPYVKCISIKSRRCLSQLAIANSPISDSCHSPSSAIPKCHSQHINNYQDLLFAYASYNTKSSAKEPNLPFLTRSFYLLSPIHWASFDITKCLLVAVPLARAMAPLSSTKIHSGPTRLVCPFHAFPISFPMRL